MLSTALIWSIMSEVIWSLELNLSFNYHRQQWLLEVIMPSESLESF